MRYYGNFIISEQIYFLRSYENKEVLANLKTEPDKNLRLPISEEIQPLTKYFGTFFISYCSYSSYSIILFTLSETELDPHHQKLNVGVTSRVVKRLEEILVKPRN